MKSRNYFILILSLMCNCFFSAIAQAQGLSVIERGQLGDNIKYEVREDGQVTVSGTGAMYDFTTYANCEQKQTPFYKYDKTIKSVIIGNGVTSIGERTFYGCTELTTVTLPATLRTIGVSAFSYCLNLGSITFPAGLTKIDEMAFHATDIKDLTIPKSLSSLGPEAFEPRTINQIKVNPLNKWYDSRNNCNAIIKKNGNELVLGCKNTIIPNTVKIIGENAFNGCELGEMKIPGSVVSIKEKAFFCAGLKSIVIPNSVTEIGKEAFVCNRFKQVTLSNSLKVIPEKAFNACKELEFVSIPGSVTKIESFAFSDCDNLIKAEIPKTTEVNTYAFQKYGDKRDEKVEIVYTEPSVSNNNGSGSSAAGDVAAFQLAEGKHYRISQMSPDAKHMFPFEADICIASGTVMIMAGDGNGNKDGFVLLESVKSSETSGTLYVYTLEGNAGVINVQRKGNQMLIGVKEPNKHTIYLASTTPNDRPTLK